MTIRNLIILSAICLAFFLTSCNSGYQKEENKWTWVSYDEAVGKREGIIEEADLETFSVLENDKYAKDKNNVYFNGGIIPFADPNSFKVIDNGYSKDNASVYLDWDKVIFADPKTFEQLVFPYSRDLERVFCGTLPIEIEKNEVTEFKVTNDNESMSGMKSTILLSHFIEFNPEYKWLDTLGINGVIIGEWATGATKNKKFRGFKQGK